MIDLRYIATPSVLDTLSYFVWKLTPFKLTSACLASNQKFKLAHSAINHRPSPAKKTDSDLPYSPTVVQEGRDGRDVGGKGGRGRETHHANNLNRISARHIPLQTLPLSHPAMVRIKQGNQTFEDRGRAFLDLLEPASETQVCLAVGATFTDKTLRPGLVSFGCGFLGGGSWRGRRGVVTPWVRTMEQTRQARRFRP